MACSVTYNPESDLVETVYSGRVTAEDVLYAATERIRLQREEGASWQVLIDTRQTTQLVAGAFDFYKLQDVYREEPSNHRTQIAVVLPDGDEHARAGALFFETLCVNRGWLVSSFDEMDEAVSWLAELKKAEDSGGGVV